MNILAIDTASTYFSAAIISNGIAADCFVAKEKNRPAEILVPTIERLLRQNHLSYNNVQALVTTLGPGSFIGIRIGIATLQGISLITKTPFYGISNLELIAFIQSQHKKTKGNIKAIIKRDSDSAYKQTFSPNLVPLEAPRIVTISDLSSDADTHGFTNTNTIPNAKNAGLLASIKITQERFTEMPIKPIYIHKMC